MSDTAQTPRSYTKMGRRQHEEASKWEELAPVLGQAATKRTKPSGGHAEGGDATKVSRHSEWVSLHGLALA